MEKCRVFVAYRGAKKRDGDRVTRRKASPSYICILPLLFARSLVQRRRMCFVARVQRVVQSSDHVPFVL